MFYDGSKRTTPELRFAPTHDSCIDPPWMRSFFALSAAKGFVAVDADCANTPSTTQPTYVSIDDAYADWYRPYHGNEVARACPWYHQPRGCSDDASRLSPWTE
jgi:hypothetical protein